MKDITKLTEFVETNISFRQFDTQIAEIDNPLNYFMGLGGKRLRPAMAYLIHKLYGKSLQTEGLEPFASSVEFFHNFSLIHDDIMDRADLRRGKPTIHTKWNENIGILSGDYLLIEAYKTLEQLPTTVFASIFSKFNQTAQEVCLGQQLDMNFENLEQIEPPQYMEMIRQKTAVLVGYSLYGGALLAEVSLEEAQTLYEIGVAIGISFQILDDVLDTFGDEKVGKKIGGDIEQGKKTILYVLTLEAINSTKKTAFVECYQLDRKDKIEQIKSIFLDLEIEKKARILADNYTREGMTKIDELSLSDENKKLLKLFFSNLLDRTF